MPNAGFLEDVVFGDPSLSTTDATSDHENNADSQELEVANAIIDDLDDSSSNINISQQVITDLDNLKVTENVESDKGTAAEDQNTLSVEDVDALLDKCLLQAFYTTMKDKDLPIAGSTLW